MKESKAFNLIQKISNVWFGIVGSAMLVFTVFLLFPSFFLIVYSLKYFVIEMFLSLIAALCSLLIIPATCKSITKKYNFNIKWWHKYLIILFWFFIFIVSISVISLGFNSKTTQDTSMETIVQDVNLTTTTLSSEQTIRAYARSVYVSDFDDEIRTVSQASEYSAGYQADYNKLYLDYLDSVKKSCSKITSSCLNANSLYEELYPNDNKINSLGCNPYSCSFSYSFTLLNVSLLEDNGNESIYNITYLKDKKQDSTKYKLQNINGTWKIVDIQSSGKWSTKNTLFKKNDEFENSTENYEVGVSLITEIERRLVELKQVKTSVSSSVKNAINQENIIEVDVNDNNDGTYSASVWYYFDGSWADNYLQAMTDATEIYKQIYRSERRISSVQITAIELYFDSYGHQQQRTLSDSTMSKSTANKIEWDHFESQNLDDITTFNFYQNSLYKSLQDLQEQLQKTQDYYERQQSVYQQYMESYNGMYS